MSTKVNKLFPYFPVKREKTQYLEKGGFEMKNYHITTNSINVSIEGLNIADRPAEQIW